MKRSKKNVLATVMSLSVLFGSIPTAFAEYQPGIPEAVDPGTPEYKGLEKPVPAEPVKYDPSKSMLEEIYKADKAAGGESYWMDQILERPGSEGGNDLFTRGRALYMFTHQPNVLGFGGGYAYREMPTGSAQNMYSITLSDTSLSEDASKRKQYPSYWLSVHNADGLNVAQKKFITYNNVAVTILDIENTSNSNITKTVNVASPIVSKPSKDGKELTGVQKARYDLTTMYPRLSGEGMEIDGTKLTKSITLKPGESTTVKVQMGGNNKRNTRVNH